MDPWVTVVIDVRWCRIRTLQGTPSLLLYCPRNTATELNGAMYQTAIIVITLGVISCLHNFVENPHIEEDRRVRLSVEISFLPASKFLLRK